jgi:hypothetical protein
MVDSQNWRTLVCCSTACQRGRAGYALSHWSRKALSRHVIDTIEIWNRKIHFYISLFLLFFLWLFAFTGLLLNHSDWTFAEFWPNRRQTDVVRAITSGDLSQARDIMKQLGIAGEIEWTTTRSDPEVFEFQVTRPGHSYRIKADLVQSRVTLHRDDLNVWGVMHVLHTFTGVRLADSKNERDWPLTSVWAFSMDAVATGLIVMVFSSYYWYVLIRKRVLGLLALGLGIASCDLFAIGLRWMVP